MNEKETGRVEAFSDGVFAIAITLLILEIKVPHQAANASDAALTAALIQLWPSFVAFAGSFFAILIMWVNHHGLFKMVHRADARFLYANGFLLLLVTFVPFPTAVLAEYLDHPGANAAAAFYCGTFILISVAYNLLWHVAASGRRLIAHHVPQDHVDKIRRAYRWGFLVYVGAAALALWNAAAGLAVCLSLWVLWTVLNYSPKENAGAP
jgi:uncharacterized membrane protein